MAKDTVQRHKEAHLYHVLRERALSWLSWLWPLTVAKAHGRHGDLEVRYEAGQLVLNSRNGNQSFGSLHRVWQQAFEHIGLKVHQPANVLLLGLGGGSAPAILRNELGIKAPITAVEIDAAMVELGRKHFGLGHLSDLNIVLTDAILHVHTDVLRYDLVVVDLFNDLDLARGVETMGFAHALRDRCAGTLCFNSVAYDSLSGARCQRVRDNLGKVFSSVDELVLEGVNRVFIAR